MAYQFVEIRRTKKLFLSSTTLFNIGSLFCHAPSERTVDSTVLTVNKLKKVLKFFALNSIHL